MAAIDILVLKYFISVCDFNSITKAANQYYISRQAVSKAIKKLEAELNTPLLHAQNKGLVLTQAGQCFYENAKKIVGIWDKTLWEIEQTNSAKTVIHAGYGQMVYGRWKQDYIESFENKYPNIHIAIEAFMPQRLITLLFERKLDIIFSAASFRSDDIACETIISHPLSIAMCADDPLAAKTVVDIHDLEARTLLYLKSDPVFFLNFRDFFCKERLNVHMEYADISDTAFTLIALKRKRHCILYLESSTYRRELLQGEYTILATKRCPRKTYVHII